MATYVALLRAVNVAGRKVGMAELREGMAQSGLHGVRTYVQSGNVVFEAESGEPGEHAAAIERLIAHDFGLESRVLVLTSQGLAQIAAANPFLATGADERSLHATFLFTPVAQTDFEVLRPPAQDGEEAALVGPVVYLHLPHGYGRSKLGNAYFERALRTPATTRNWRTVIALTGLCSSGG